MNIGQLEYLVETVNQGSYAKAAQQLYVTPQAVSKSIGELEKELCTKLLEKSGRGVRPTGFAVSFSSQAEEVLRVFSDLKTFAKSQSAVTSRSGIVTLAVTATGHPIELFHESDFTQFSSMYPNIDLQLLFFSSESCLSAFREGIVDAALILGEYNEFKAQSHKLFSFDLVACVSSEHEFSNKNEVSLKDLASCRIAMPQDSRCVFSAIQKKFSYYQKHPRFELVAPYKEALKDFLDHGGVAFSAGIGRPSSTADGTKAIKLCQFDKIQIPVYLVYRETSEPSPLPLLGNYLRRTMHATPMKPH